MFHLKQLLIFLSFLLNPASAGKHQERTEDNYNSETFIAVFDADAYQCITHYL